MRIEPWPIQIPPGNELGDEGRLRLVGFGFPGCGCSNKLNGRYSPDHYIGQFSPGLRLPIEGVVTIDWVCFVLRNRSEGKIGPSCLVNDGVPGTIAI